MDIKQVLCSAAAAKEFKETKNYYFEDHICSADGNNKRIRMDYILADDITDEMARFGFCGECGLCVYHMDHKSSFM